MTVSILKPTRRRPRPFSSLFIIFVFLSVNRASSSSSSSYSKFNTIPKPPPKKSQRLPPPPPPPRPPTKETNTNAANSTQSKRERSINANRQRPPPPPPPPRPQKSVIPAKNSAKNNDASNPPPLSMGDLRRAALKSKQPSGKEDDEIGNEPLQETASARQIEPPEKQKSSYASDNMSTSTVSQTKSNSPPPPPPPPPKSSFSADNLPTSNVLSQAKNTRPPPPPTPKRKSVDVAETTERSYSTEQQAKAVDNSGLERTAINVPGRQSLPNKEAEPLSSPKIDNEKGVGSAQDSPQHVVGSSEEVVESIKKTDSASKSPAQSELRDNDPIDQENDESSSSSLDNSAIASTSDTVVLPASIEKSQGNARPSDATSKADATAFIPKPPMEAKQPDMGASQTPLHSSAASGIPPPPPRKEIMKASGDVNVNPSVSHQPPHHPQAAWGGPQQHETNQHQIQSSRYSQQIGQQQIQSSQHAQHPGSATTPMGSLSSQRMQGGVPQHHPQQSRPTPRMQRPVNPPGRSSAPPIFKSLWSKVERGLDSLADLEDVISDRAQNLVNSAVPKSLRKPPSSYIPPTIIKKPRASAKPKPTSQPLKGPQLRWENMKNLQEAQSTPKPGQTGPTQKPSVSLYQINKSSSSSMDSLPPKARKLMPANGGASSPNDGGEWGYPGDQKYGEQGSDADKEANRMESNSPGIPNPLQSASANQPGSDQMRFGTGQLGSSNMPAPTTREGGWSQIQAAKDAATSSSASKSPNGGRSPIRPAGAPAPTARESLSWDDDDKPSLISRVLGMIPFPSFSFGKIFRFGRSKGYSDYASLDAWAAQDTPKKSRGIFGFLRPKGEASAPAVSTKKASKDEVASQPVQQLLERSSDGKSLSLLSSEDKKTIRGLGESRAVLDIVALGFFLVGIRQVQGLELIPFPLSFSEFVVATVPSLLETFILSLDTWAPLAFAAAILAIWSNSLRYDRRIQRRATDVAEEAEAEARYSRLYLRLVASTATGRDLPSQFFNAARLQGIALAETSRLRSFISYAAAIIILMTVDFIKPLFLCISRTLLHLVSLQELRMWPVPFEKLLASTKTILGAAGHDLTSLFGRELKGAGHHPLQVVFKASILVALLAVAYLPSLEKRRKIAPKDDGEEEDAEDVARKMAEQVMNMGASGATRLGFQSKRGWAESAIERWRLVDDESSALENDDVSGRSLFRRLGYCLLSWLILAAPLLIFGFLLHVPMTGWSSTPMSPWQSFFELSVLLLYTNGLVWETMAKVVESRDLPSEIPSFLASLSEASSELNSQTASIRPALSVNPTAGLVVKDLWSAHVFKRAWAVRGANLSCRNGEVLVLLGDDGAGKSRLMTTVAESLVAPPKQSLTATKVRGSVSIGGIDVTQWDRNELRKRIGLCLTDVNSLALRAGMWSGTSLEEILEPGDGFKITDPTHASGRVEKACVVLALKLTGLYWSLLPRLPSKLSTILTTNEEDLRPSPLRPRYNVISPTDWSKLLLAQVLAQMLYDNDSTSASADKIDGRLAGSVLLLDDGTSMLSEIEESKLLRDLRQTGAATILSSNKWASGRLADRIVVMKDGSIVETGTHSELLSRGPQQSLYAAKWHAMTSS